MRYEDGPASDRGPLRAFTRAERLLVRPVDQRDIDLGHVRHPDDRVVRPVARLDTVPVEADLLIQRPTRGLDDAALMEGARRSSMDELATATVEAHKVLVF